MPNTRIRSTVIHYAPAVDSYTTPTVRSIVCKPSELLDEIFALKQKGFRIFGTVTTTRPEKFVR
jgi:hypothetical protein